VAGVARARTTGCFGRVAWPLGAGVGFGVGFGVGGWVGVGVGFVAVVVVDEVVVVGGGWCLKKGRVRLWL